MLRNKAALPVLQKTYDESYLTCSTAVYYEGQVSRRTMAQCIISLSISLESILLTKKLMHPGKRKRGDALLENRT